MKTIDLLNINPGKNIPKEFNAVVEIPKKCTLKFELDKELRTIVLDRALRSAVYYPGEYGFIPQTLAEDGDPLDVIIRTDYDPTFPGCVIRCRPVGVLRMIDGGAADHKLLAIPSNDHRQNHVQDIINVSSIFMDEVNHFFNTYKELENKEVCTGGWQGREEAEKIIMESLARYRKENNGN